MDPLSQIPFAVLTAVVAPAVLTNASTAFSTWLSVPPPLPR